MFLNSRELIIEYIDFIKPVNQDKEQKFNKILFPNLSFENYTFNHTYNYTKLRLELEKELKKIGLKSLIKKIVQILLIIQIPEKIIH